MNVPNVFTPMKLRNSMITSAPIGIIISTAVLSGTESRWAMEQREVHGVRASQLGAALG